jgi:hypothetical protein
MKNQYSVCNLFILLLLSFLSFITLTEAINSKFISSLDPDSELVYSHVRDSVNQTFREPEGQLFYRYQVPGSYTQLWDWDSVFLGVASARDFNASSYFIGSMSNFLSKTNITTGEVKGCLTPQGDSPTLFHAKPILIQGAYLAAKYDNGNYSFFKQFQAQMQSLLTYWDNSTSRIDPKTGLHRWHDQLESGADNLVLSVCPSPYSTWCWIESIDAFTLSAPDLELFIAREHLAYSNFLQKWAAEDKEKDDDKYNLLISTIETHRVRAKTISDTVDNLMFTWIDEAQTRGYYGGFNTSTQAQITNRIYQAAWPLWSGGTQNLTLIQLAARELFKPDLWSPFGVRSVSNGDPRYNNDNIINPYSNWRGPIWINVNSVLAYALNSQGFIPQAQDLAARIVHTLAEDLRTTGTWHEAYSSETGEGLAAPGFLSWNTLGATLVRDIVNKFDPFAID